MTIDDYEQQTGEARVCRIHNVRTILSITDGHMIAPSFTHVRKLFAWLVGDEDGDLSDYGAVLLHQAAADALLEEFPKLAEVTVPDGLSTDEKIATWLSENDLDYALAVPQLLAGTRSPS